MAEFLIYYGHMTGAAYGWSKTPHTAFGASSALDIMLHGELTDLMRVRGSPPMPRRFASPIAGFKSDFGDDDGRST